MSFTLHGLYALYAEDGLKKTVEYFRDLQKRLGYIIS